MSPKDLQAVGHIYIDYDLISHRGSVALRAQELRLSAKLNSLNSIRYDTYNVSRLCSVLNVELSR